MAHEDQFTATGPAFEGAGFPRAAFSTNRAGTDSTYGVNVQGSVCGVYGESRTLPQSESSRETIDGTGVCGKGQNYGVSGLGGLAGVYGLGDGTDSSGVIGENRLDGFGVAGLNLNPQDPFSLGKGIGVIGASNEGAGIVGLSIIKIRRGSALLGVPVILPREDTPANGEGIGVKGASGTGTGVFGESNSGTGVIGRSDGAGDGVKGNAGTGIGVRGDSRTGFGVFGFSDKQSGVVGRSNSTVAPGVFGSCDRLTGVAGRSIEAPGVFGDSAAQAGVLGRSAVTVGVFGFCEAAFKLPAPPAGVFGVNDNSVGVVGSSVKVIGVWGNTDKGLGVVGTANFGAGAPTEGITDQGIGVIGLGNSGFGVAGMSTSGTGVFGSSASGLAGHFRGPVMIEGDVTIVGSKSAAVPHPDGSHRQLYCMESPESWFEDFGEGQLVGGKAEVRLDVDFAALVQVNGYHVFLTPYGESSGMFVAERYATGFRVREQQGGTNTVGFAYRVVAKRKDIVPDRLATVVLPDVTRDRQLPDLRLKTNTPDFERLSVNPLDRPGSDTGQ